MLSNQSDGQLESSVERACQGDVGALGELYDRFNHLVLRYFAARSTPDAADLASDTWLSVASSIRRFNGTGSDFAPWLFTIAHRRLVDHRRRWAKRPEQLREALPEVSVEQEYSVAIGLADALALLRALPDSQAEAIALRVVADLDVARVSAIMGISESNVRVLTHRGLTTLRQLVVTDAPLTAMKGVS